MGNWFCCVDEMGYVGGIINRVGFVAGEVEIGVVIILVLVKLFLKRWLICLEFNSPPVAICFLILSSVHFIDLFSCNVLKNDYKTVICLSFLIYIL